MQDTVSDALVDSVFASIVSTAEKQGVQSDLLVAKLLDRSQQQKQYPNNKKRKTAHETSLITTSQWWKVLPSELTSSVLDFLPRRSLAGVSECSRECNQVISDYARGLLMKADLGKSLFKRHLEGTSAERGKFSPAFLLYCLDAAPEIGAYFGQMGLEIRHEFDTMMRNMYPNDIYQENSYASWARVMFMIDGIVVSQAIEGDTVGRHRFRVCRCPLPALIRSMKPQAVEAWISGGRVQRQDEMESLWHRGWTMYDFRFQNNEDDSDEDDEDEAE